MKVLEKIKTHIGIVRNKDIRQASQVQEILRWTHDQYCEHQFEQYYLFVEKLCDGWPAARDQVMYSAVFRGLWNNEWALRNEEEFLPFAIDCFYDHSNLMDEYLFMNSHIKLLHDAYFMKKYNNVIKIIRNTEKEACYV